jgi:ubiquitin C-terminal hydrolase
MYISKFPQILVIRIQNLDVDLNRFKTTGTLIPSKLSSPIDIPMELNILSAYTSPFAAHEAPKYRLDSTSNHFGNMVRGHYTATTRLWASNRWTDRNDSEVTPLDHPNLDKSAVYILFYEKI